jgi:tetratricopeptide (TPR) repeat protein
LDARICRIYFKERKILQAEEWFDKGYYHHRINKEYDKEIEAYINALSLDPNLAKAYVHRGNAYYNKEQYDGAIEDYNKALGLNPYLTAAYYHRGIAHERLGNKSMAISDYRKACDSGLKAACENLEKLSAF